MHIYLRAIGFWECCHNKDMQPFLSSALTSPDVINTAEVDDGIFVEMWKYFGEDFGLYLFGEYDENSKFILEYYYPFAVGSHISSPIPCNIQRRSDKSAFSVMCEDSQLGISIIFHMQNTLDYIHYFQLVPRDIEQLPVKLTGLSISGKILMPVMKSESQTAKLQVMSQKRAALLDSARKGDPQAIEALTINDIDTYNQVARRFLAEDLYSIVDTCFMPSGMECDQYSVIGTIGECKSLKNRVTGEKIYRLLISCNDLYLTIMINARDLLGVPAPGRRFKGEIWLQGQICFSNDEKVLEN